MVDDRYFKNLQIAITVQAIATKFHTITQRQLNPANGQ